MIIIPIKTVVAIKVIYYLPDYTSLLQEFYWATDDIHPTYPRIVRFLNFWKDNIEATINIIELRVDNNAEISKTIYGKQYSP
jgi:uncharacterized protein Usg